MIQINFTLSYLETYIIIINIFTFIIYGIDKLRAIIKSSHNRISENRLLFLVLIGGVIGSFLSMIIFRHKIKKLSFLIKFFLLLILQGLFIYYFYK